MRSIGKKNIKIVKAKTAEALRKRKDFTGSVGTYAGINEEIKTEIPCEFWDLWEGADSEINRIINDFIIDN
jgi:hypothetical protein